MKYRIMDVWSAGSEKAISVKFCLVLSIITCIILISGDILIFIRDDIGEWFAFTGIMAFSGIVLGVSYDLYRKIKQNNLIVLLLFEMEEFMKLEKIPYGLFIAFTSPRGVVLAFNTDRQKSLDFCSDIKYFYDFIDYYNNNRNVEFKTEVECTPEKFMEDMKVTMSYLDSHGL